MTTTLTRSRALLKREVAKEQKARVAGRTRLLGYVSYVTPAFQISPHHEILAKAFEAVERGEIKRLIINVPPRCSKTELITKAGAAWYMGRHPEHQVIAASYSDELATDYGRETRNKIDSPEHRTLFPMTLRADSTSANRWHTDKGGIYYSAGIGSGLTGRGAHLAIIDDPHKDWTEAKSALHRQRVYDWYQSTLYTRLMPNAAIVVVMTRWDKGDLTGRLLADDPKGWTVISLPAIDKDGKSLWPEWWPLDVLADTKKALGTVKFNTLYQQDPTDAAGRLFQRAWFKIVDAAPAEMQRVRYWDRAATEKRATNDPDWTAGCRMGLNSDKLVFIEDHKRVQGSPLTVQKLMRQTAELDGIDVRVQSEQEPGASGVESADILRRDVLGGFSFKADKKTVNKTLRAEPLAAQAEAGNVHLVRGPWNAEFLDAMEAFPDGDHDDDTDAASGAYAALSFSPGTGIIDYYRHHAEKIKSQKEP